MKKQLFLLSSVIGLTTGFGTIAADISTSIEEQKSAADLTDADRELIKEVRQALINNNTLSKYAQSIRVSAHKGTVTLQGYVASEKEKNTVLNTVNQVQGIDSVDNQLKVVMK
jgi:osmotically-inducible protein OsmY